MRATQVLIVLAAVAASAAAVASRTGDARERASSACATRRAVFGVVLGPDGDPLPGVSFESGAVRLCESNAFGEFAWFEAPSERRIVVARRAPLAEEHVPVPPGCGDAELLVHMRRSGAAARAARRFSIVDELGRGLPGADVTLVSQSDGSVVERCRSGFDGSVEWTAPPGPSDAFELRCSAPSGVRSDREAVRLVGGLAIPCDELPSARRQWLVRLAGDRAPLDGTMAAIVDSTFRVLSRRLVDAGSIETPLPEGGPFWLWADDGRHALLRALWTCNRGDAVVATGADTATLSLPATAELERAAPVVVPVFGDARVVHGESMSDVAGGAAALVPSFTLRRIGARLVTPALDLDVRSLSLRSGCRDRDVRVLAELPPWPPRVTGGGVGVTGARVSAGRSEVKVRLVASGTEARSYFVTLSRRGGPWSETKHVASGSTATWRGLCGGAFLLTTERAFRTGRLAPGTRVRMFDDVRRVCVAPASSQFVEVAPESGCDIAGVLEVQRR